MLRIISIFGGLSKYHVSLCPRRLLVSSIASTERYVTRWFVGSGHPFGFSMRIHLQLYLETETTLQVTNLLGSFWHVCRGVSPKIPPEDKLVNLPPGVLCCSLMVSWWEVSPVVSRLGGRLQLNGEVAEIPGFNVFQKEHHHHHHHHENYDCNHSQHQSASVSHTNQSASVRQHPSNGDGSSFLLDNAALDALERCKVAGVTRHEQIIRQIRQIHIPITCIRNPMSLRVTFFCWFNVICIFSSVMLS